MRHLGRIEISSLPSEQQGPREVRFDDVVDASDDDVMIVDGVALKLSDPEDVRERTPLRPV